MKVKGQHSESDGKQIRGFSPTFPLHFIVCIFSNKGYICRMERESVPNANAEASSLPLPGANGTIYFHTLLIVMFVDACICTKFVPMLIPNDS
jgi:hypothetical protein